MRFFEVPPSLLRQHAMLGTAPAIWPASPAALVALVAFVAFGSTPEQQLAPLTFCLRDSRGGEGEILEKDVRGVVRM